MLMFMPIVSKADRTDCGEYVDVDENSNEKISVSIRPYNYRYKLCVEDNCFADINGRADLSSCPDVIYSSEDNMARVQYSLSKPTGRLFKEFTKSDNNPDTPNPDTPIKPSDKYKDVELCRNTQYEFISDCGCMPAALADLVSRLYFILKVGAPAILLIIGGFDLIKAMSAQDESAIKKAQTKLVKKFVAAAMVFLIFTLVQFLVSIISNSAEDTMKCIDYLLNGYNV